SGRGRRPRAGVRPPGGQDGGHGSRERVERAGSTGPWAPPRCRCRPPRAGRSRRRRRRPLPSPAGTSADARSGGRPVIAILEGTIGEKGAGRVVVSVGGVGYDVIVTGQTLTALPAQGRSARLYTRLQVRDDAMVLYGFASPDERSLFDHLITVTGVG